MRLTQTLAILALTVTVSGPALSAGSGGEGDDIVGPYFAGLIAGSRGDAMTAADYLLDVAGRAQPSREVLGPALRAAISAGRIDEAVAVAYDLIAVSPGGSEAALLLLVAESALAGDWDDARARLAALPGGNLSRTRRILLDGWAILPLEGVDRSLQVISPIDGNPGLDILHKLHKALLLDVAGKPEATAAYQAVLDAGTQSSGRTVMLASNYFARAGDREKAKAILEGALAGGRGRPTLEAVLAELKTGETPAPIVPDVLAGIGEVFLQIAATLADEGPDELSLQEARLASYAAPDSPAALLLVSEALSRLDRHDEAVAGYDRLLDDPRHGSAAALARADALAAAKRFEAAQVAYRELAALRGDDPDPLIRLGNMLRWERRFEESLAAYDEAVLRVQTEDPAIWLLYYFRGISNERTGKWEAAEADFQQALALNPDQPQVLNYLGYSWVEKGKHLDEARAMLERAVALRPDDGYIVDSLGWALYRLGDYEEAVRQLERAVELDPGQAVINDHLGDAYWRVGRKREALVQWHRTLSLGEDPDIDPEEVRQKLERGLPPIDAEAPNKI